MSDVFVWIDESIILASKHRVAIGDVTIDGVKAQTEPDPFALKPVRIRMKAGLTGRKVRRPVEIRNNQLLRRIADFDVITRSSNTR